MSITYVGVYLSFLSYFLSLSLLDSIYLSIGFSGELCNYEYNECDSNPCLNDGQCTDHIGGFSCKCTRGYTGKRCHIKVSICFFFLSLFKWFFIILQCWLQLNNIWQNRVWGAWMVLFCNHFIYIQCYFRRYSFVVVFIHHSIPVFFGCFVVVSIFGFSRFYKFPNAFHKIKCEIDVVMLQFIKALSMAHCTNTKCQIVLDVVLRIRTLEQE